MFEGQFLLFYDRGPYHIETSPLYWFENCSVNEWIGFYTIGTSVMKELKWYKIKMKRKKDKLCENKECDIASVVNRVFHLVCLSF